MESYEILKSLPESTKAKYFEDFLESIKHAADDNNDPVKNNKKLSLNTILNNFASEHVSSEGSPKKKQKTLDSWLIKSKTSSKKHTGEHSGASEESSSITQSLDTNNVSERLYSTQSKLNSSSDGNSANSSNIDKNSSKSVECLPYESEKVYSNVKVVPISQPEINKPTYIVNRKCSSRSKRKYTDSSQVSESENSAKCSNITDNINLKKSKRVITQLHVTDNCGANYDASSENIISEHNSDDVLKESFNVISTSSTNNVSNCLNFTQSKINNSNDETSSSLSKIPENSTQNVEHSPCKSDKAHNNFLKDAHISQSEISESTRIVTRKGNLRSKKKCPEPPQISKSKNSAKSSNVNDSISLNESNSVVAQSHIVNNSDVPVENVFSDYNTSNVPLKVSHEVIISSDSNDVSECIDSIQSKSNNSNDENCSLQNAVSKVKVQISLPKISDFTGIVTRTRAKRKCVEPPQLSEPENSTISSSFTDKCNSNRAATKPLITNNCDVKQGASENIVSEPSNLVSENDSQETDNLCSLNKGTRNLRSRKVEITLPSIPRSSTKLEQNAAKNIDTSKKILSPEKDKVTDSSLLSNREAFCILEKECSRLNINVLDILQDETVQNVLNDPNRLNNDTYFLINSFKSSNETTLPVVHLLESWKKLTETIRNETVTIKEVIKKKSI